MTYEEPPETISRDTHVGTWVFIGTVAIIALVIAIFVFVRPNDVGEDAVNHAPDLPAFVIDGVEVSAA